MSSNTEALRPAQDRPRTPAGTPLRQHWHRTPKGADVLGLIFKISSKDGWSTTLRSNPGVILVADDDKLACISRDFALAILQGHGQEMLNAMRQTAPPSRPAQQDTGSRQPGQQRRRLAAGPRGSRAAGR